MIVVLGRKMIVVLGSSRRGRKKVWFISDKMQRFCCKYNVKRLCFVQNFQHLTLYSTSINGVIHSFANYLVNDLGFSQQQALSTSTKLQTQKVNDFNFSDNANSVIHFLKQHDFDDTHVRKVVSLYPRILCSRVDKTLKPRFKILQDLGFSGSNLITVISNSPTFVAKRMYNVLTKLRTILGGDENLMKLFRKSSNFATAAGFENLVSNVELLKNACGVDIQAIRNSVLMRPRSFLRGTEFTRNVVVRVEEELGIPCDSKMFLYGFQLLSSYGKKNIESKCQVFKSFGWSGDQVSDLMRRSPAVFHISDESIRKKLGFLLNEMGYGPNFLVSRSALFTYSLEKRLLPRHRVLLILKEKGLLDYNFYSASKKTETQFLRIFVEPFKDVVPGLLEIYHQSKGCPNVAAK